MVTVQFPISDSPSSTKWLRLLIRFEQRWGSAERHKPLLPNKMRRHWLQVLPKLAFLLQEHQWITGAYKPFCLFEISALWTNWALLVQGFWPEQQTPLSPVLLPCQASVYRALLGDQDGEGQLANNFVTWMRLTAYDSSLILVCILTWMARWMASVKNWAFSSWSFHFKGFEERFFQR